MDIEHHVVDADGKRVGDLISLGQNFLLFTTNPELTALDGRSFSSPQEAALQVAAALNAAPLSVHCTDNGTRFSSPPSM
ncbi:MAG: hypothetical protein ACTS3R_10205 [Inquilinaceae bacterium]